MMKLNLSDSKIEILLIEKNILVKECKTQISSIELNTHHIKFLSSFKNFGVIFDKQLSFKAHKKAISSTNMARFFNLCHVRFDFNKFSFEIIIHSTILSRFDYCISLLAGLLCSSLHQFQFAQNFTGRLTCHHSKFFRITHAFSELHWLSITSKIKFRILIFIHKSLNGLATPYLSNLLSLYESSRPLQSSNSNKLSIPFTNTISMGDCTFFENDPLL